MVDTLEVGGTERQMVQVVQRLDPRAFRVTVGCLHAGGPLTKPLQNAGVRIVEFRKGGTLLSFHGAYQFLRLAQFIRREGFDVVHSHDLWANLMAVPAARLARAPVIISSQRNLAHLSWYTPFRKRVMRRIHLLATCVIANSGAAKQLLVKDFRIPAGRVHVLHNAVDFEQFADCQGDRQKLYPGLKPGARLVIHLANMNTIAKGHAVLIEAARAVCAAIPDAKFILVGDGPLRPNLEERVREVGLHDHFLFLGRREDVREILSCGDLFVFSSLAEGLPNAVLEAAAAGLPLVATRAGGIPEIIEDGVSGLLVPPNDPQALAEAVLCVLTNPGLAARLARAGQEQARSQFGFDRLLGELEPLYLSPSAR